MKLRKKWNRGFLSDPWKQSLAFDDLADVWRHHENHLFVVVYALSTECM